MSSCRGAIGAVGSSAKTLVVSYIGLQTQTVTIKPNLKVMMKSDSEMLDEVMVVAYGTAKKSSFTGSASVVSGEKISKMQTSNVSKSLEGAMAGVQISQSSGQPGSSGSIYVRGLGSISAGKEALIVVDGVPYEGSLNQIAPNDIESMTVLKDAAANSLYGARGANGVVLITTKKGKTGKAKVVFENRTGVNMRGVPSYDVLDSPQNIMNCIGSLCEIMLFMPKELRIWKQANMLQQISLQNWVDTTIIMFLQQNWLIL